MHARLRPLSRVDSSRRALVSALLLGLVASWLACASGPPPTPTELGWQALEARDWAAAKGHFDAALRADAGDVRAWHGRAEAQLGARDPEAALGSLGRLARVDAEYFRDAAHATHADVLAAATRSRLGRGKAVEALQSARSLARLEPSRRGLPALLGDAVVEAADALRLVGRRDEAFALFEEGTRVAPGRLEGWIGAAEILLEQREGKRAIRLLESARRVHPTAGVIRSLTLQALQYR